MIIDKKIGILYIAIGKYIMFWDTFYQSIEEYFITSCDKEYFVYTDQLKHFKNMKSNVHVIFQKDLGWPGNTLMRYKFFMDQEKMFDGLDYMFFFNANLLVVKNINENFLPIDKEILVARHPGYINCKTVNEFPYCRDKRSLAYIPYGEGEFYFQGALWGGKRDACLNMISELSQDVERDNLNRVVANCHDESHLNRYAIRHTNILKMVGPEYIYPEGNDIDCDPFIISRDKSKYFNVYKYKNGFLKNLKRNAINILLCIYLPLKRKIKKVDEAK